jgi:transaldolase / glucose-6-phosphate isomerase
MVGIRVPLLDGRPAAARPTAMKRRCRRARARPTKEVAMSNGNANDEAVSRLRMLGRLGQSVWLDFIDRAFLASGGLEHLIEQDGVSGVTSNPSIFERAITQGSDYDRQLLDEWARPAATAYTVYDALVARDISKAADILLPLYRRRGGCDGYVSVEVLPDLATDTDSTIDEARRLWNLIGKPNLMIKIPGTDASIPAIRQLIEEGINVNVTLLFAVERYAEVLEAHISGLENRANRGLAIDEVAGVASFFVSRIDAVVDSEIEARIAAGDVSADALRSLKGQIAIANAKSAYQHHLAVTKGVRWRILADKGALPHRLLWASTGTKDPGYSDVLYVDGLIGRNTVSTIPPQTMDAFRDHGTVAPTLCAAIDDARPLLKEAKKLGIDLDAITAELLRAGVEQFAQSVAHTVRAVAEKRRALQALASALDGRTDNR